MPARDYRTLALALAETVELIGGDERAEEAARRAGGRLASKGEDLGEVLRRRGYEPYEEGSRVRLRNCPFHVLAEEHPLLVCSMNLEFCRGLLEGIGEDAEGRGWTRGRVSAASVFLKLMTIDIEGAAVVC
ncbi:hypothetical protein ACFQX6_19300 [Streptosporangium lutulentum]